MEYIEKQQALVVIGELLAIVERAHTGSLPAGVYKVVRQMLKHELELYCARDDIKIKPAGIDHGEIE